jgi:hypothetical protein
LESQAGDWNLGREIGISGGKLESQAGDWSLEREIGILCGQIRIFDRRMTI